MGWTSFFATTRDEAIAEVTKPGFFGNGYTPLEHRIVGNNIWKLIEEPDGHKGICLIRIECWERGWEWGYKICGEESGPVYYDCPRTLIQKASPPRNDFAREWRKKNIERLKMARKVASLSPGEFVVVNGRPYSLLSKSKGSWLVSCLLTNKTYKCRRSSIQLTTPEEVTALLAELKAREAAAA